MKIFLGILIGAGLMFGGVAMAQTYGPDGQKHGIVQISLETQGWYTLIKAYDYDNGVVCYIASGSGKGISCLHN